MRFDSNKYSVKSKAVGRSVEVHTYAERIVIKKDGVVVGKHARRFGRQQTATISGTYVPVLGRKPGTLRARPFNGWPLPGSIEPTSCDRPQPADRLAAACPVTSLLEFRDEALQRLLDQIGK